MVPAGRAYSDILLLRAAFTRTKRAVLALVALADPALAPGWGLAAAEGCGFPVALVRDLMESTTKNRQPSATLRAMIARAYGASAVPDGDGFATELGHGWFNVAYQVTLRDGRRVVLKIAPPADVAVLAYERGMMRNEIAAMRLLAEHATVPMPAVD